MQCVYRFTDLKDNIIKYVGIVHGNDRSLKERTYERLQYDKWCLNTDWRVDYIIVNSRSEAESLESHFIAVYNTGNYFNKAKSEWGINSFMLNIEFDWKEYCIISGKMVELAEDDQDHYPLRFTRIGLSINWKSEVEFQEAVVLGKTDAGIITLNDGSIIDTTSIGKIYADCDWIIEHYKGDYSMIANGRCRSRKFAHTDLITYFVDDAVSSQLKKVMIDIATSRYQYDCAASQKKYNRAKECYERNASVVNCLNNLLST